MIKRCPQHGFFRGEHCECGSAGQLLLDETKTEQLGRLVAGGLRHFPGDLGLEMDSRGWVDLTKLGQVVTEQASLGRQRIGDCAGTIRFQAEIRDR